MSALTKAPSPKVVENDSEHQLGERFANKQKFERKSDEDVALEYLFTRDPAILHQYYVLRQEMYTKVWNLEGFDGLEDRFDAQSHAVVTMHHNQVVAGSRLVASTPRKRRELPLESEGVDLKKYFPELYTNEVSFGECCRTVVLPEYSRMRCTGQMFLHILRKAEAMGLSYIFCMAPRPVVRVYSLESRALKLDFEVIKECTVSNEDDGGVPLTLMRWKVALPEERTKRFEIPDSLQQRKQRLLENT